MRSGVQTGRLRQSKEFIGNAGTVIPARVPHKTLAAASSVDSHLHPRRVPDVLQQDFLELQPTYLVRDLLIEELARSLYLESESGHLNASEERQRATHPMKEDVKEKTPSRPSQDVGVVTYIQTHHILSEVMC